MGLAVKPKIMIKFLEANGFTVKNIEGSHHVMTNNSGRTVPVPKHNEDLKIGTLLSILNQAGLTKKDLLKWLGRV